MAQVLRHLPPITDHNVLVGINTSDDAGVYRLNNNQAVVATVDFFTPIVDDPFAFGMIAAANALSDIYAMGGRPLFALNLVGFPRDTLSFDILEQILAGGCKKATEAGIAIIGGHSIDDREPKYGLSVTGLVHPDQIITNVGARPGDRLFLTKPLGSGILTTAIKRGLASAETIAMVTEVMATLNRAGAEAMSDVRPHAATDVTGYGLLGHLWEMVSGSGAGAIVYRQDIPVLPGVVAFAEQGVVPGGTGRNMASLEGTVAWGTGIEEVDRIVLSDAQTSGGLLIAVAPDQAEALRAALFARGTLVAAEIGTVIEENRIVVEQNRQ